MYFTIYKTTCLVNNKIYIGKHKTNNLEDGYLGSGKLLKYAVEKYGKENFIVERIFLKSEDEMNEMEELLVDKDFLLREDVYNIKLGGEGGWDFINSNESFMKEKNKLGGEISRDNGSLQKASETFSNLMQDPIYRKEFCTKVSNGKIGKPGSFLGLKHSDETKLKISESAKNRLSDPTKNSQYGTRWIYSLEEKRSKKIKKTDPLPHGWYEGRKIKFS